MKWISLSCILFLACALPSVTAAQESIWEPSRHAFTVPTALYSSDSEGFHLKKLGAGYYPWYQHGDQYIGLQSTWQKFSQHGWQREGATHTLTARDISLKTGIGYAMNLGISTQGSRSLLTTDSNWGVRLGATTNGELFINRDWVESQNALSQGISHNFLGGSIEQQLAPRFSVVGVLGEQFFSDGNAREHARVKLIYDVIPEYGITLQGRFRIYHSDDSNVNGNYFNPQHYREEMLAIGIRRRLEGWMLNSTLGLGQQHIDSAPHSRTKLAQLEVTSPKFGNVFLRANASYSEAAGFNGPNYRYRSIQAALVFAY